MKNQRGDFSRNSRILFLSSVAFVIGILAAFTAKALLLLIALFTNLFYYAEFSFESKPPSMIFWGGYFILVPVVGGLLIGLIAKFGSEKIRGHGIPEALEAILFGKSIMQPKVAILKPLSSAISIGSGGPFGAEGPIIMTGGAIGSILAQFLHLTSAERKTLLVAGASAGMAAVFNTPMAALLLAIELLLFEWKPRSFVPVAVAASTAGLLRAHLLGAGPIFPIQHHALFADLDLAFAVGVGLLTGAFSTLISSSLYKLEDMFEKLPIHWMWWPALGGVAVGIGGYIQPKALGVGYELIGDLLNSHMLTPVLISFFIVKLVIWIVALASGTSGGVLAPLLIFGCAIGTLASIISPGAQSSGAWALVGMGAIMGGMMRSPLTAVIFCFELTNDTEILLPLLIASTASYAFTVWAMKRSILTEKVARRGFDIFREYSVDPLEKFRVKEVYTTGKDQIKISGLAFPKVFAEDSCRVAADLMAKNEVSHLIVVSLSSGEEIGVVDLADLLKARNLDSQEEMQRETMFPLIRTLRSGR